jgi:fatty acid desaturase
VASSGSSSRLSSNRMTHLGRLIIAWPYTKRGRIVFSIVALLMAIAFTYEFVKFGDAIVLIGAIFVFAIVFVEWVRLYRHRADPDWPRRSRPPSPR